MKAFANRISVIAAGALVLGTMAFGQSSTQNLAKVTVPFRFETARATLPAGEYSVVRNNTNGGLAMVTLRNEATRQTTIAVGSAPDIYNAGTSAVLFRCQAGSCALSGLRNDSGVISFSPVHKSTHREGVAMIALPLGAHAGN